MVHRNASTITIVTQQHLFPLKNLYLHPIQNPSDIHRHRHLGLHLIIPYLPTIVTDSEFSNHMYHPLEVHIH